MKRGQVKPGSKTALVTGARTGIGRQYAEQLAHLGYNLILVDRKEAISVVVDEINAENLGIKIDTVIQDLALPDAADKVYAAVHEKGLQVDVLVNNAGQFSFRDVADVDEEVIRSILTLHNFTLTKLCKLFVRDMIERGGGHILNMSSYSIWMPLPGIAIYGASKAYIRAFSIAFSKEVRENGVYVTAICPAGIMTDLYGLSKRFQAIGHKFGVLVTPAFCAKHALNALWRHKRSAVPDWWNCLFIPVLTHLPNWVENIIRRKTFKYQK